MNINSKLLDMTNNIADELKHLYNAEPTGDEWEEAEKNGDAVDLYGYFFRCIKH